MLKKRTGLLHAGFVVGLIGLTACGTGYREGAAAEAELGSEAHRQATFAIIRELHRSECMLFDGDDSCPALWVEFKIEMGRCLEVPACLDALAQSMEGESSEVSEQITHEIQLWRKSNCRPRRGSVLQIPGEDPCRPGRT